MSTQLKQTLRKESLKKIQAQVSGFLFAMSAYSQPRSRVNSISKNEMNIRISLCNVRRENGMLDISLEIVPKKTHLLKKRFKYLGDLKYSILACKETFIALYRQ